ncbi:Fatty acid-binding protein [Halotydeus destructor]|nr:Fatty acid-binding protein [Halotydeus destructor]
MSFVGIYKQVSHDNFDAFLAQLGASPERIAGAKNVVPTVEISQDGDNWTVKTVWSSAHSSSNTFQLGQEFEEAQLDGAVDKSTYTQDGTKWTKVQKGEHEVVFVEEFTEQGFTSTATVNGVSCVRVFERQ